MLPDLREQYSATAPHPLRNVVLDSVRIPELLRIDLHAVRLRAVVDVVACGHAGHAQVHHFAALDHVAFVYVDLAEVSVDGLQPVAVVEDDAVSLDS